MVKHKDNMHP